MKTAPFFLLLFTAFISQAATEARRPNVLLIYGDDVGWGDVSCQGSVKIQTPQIDRLASGGLRFTDGHCTASTCTPSRFALISGVHGFRHNIKILAPDAPLVIPADSLTLPRVFKQAGYQTAIIGKWHLGLGLPGIPNNWNVEVRPGPLELGFDTSFLLPYTNDRVPCVYLYDHRVLNLDPADPIHIGTLPAGAKSTVYPDGRQNPEAMTYYLNSHGHNQSVINGIGRIGVQYGGKAALWNDETMTREFVARSKAWLTARDKTRPFFLMYSAQNIHVPRTPHPDFHGKTTLGYRGDSMVEFDWAIGELLDLLVREGIEDNTMVIFSGDNGPVYDDGYKDGTEVPTSTAEVDQGHDGSGPYRGGKGQIHEGGTRVPFIVRWPQAIKPGVSNALVSQIDFLASFAKLLDVEIQAGQAIDSRDTLAALLGKDPVGLPFLIEESGGIALREGSWKYIPSRGKSGQAQLYQLDGDPGETNNLIKEHPERAAAMKARLLKIRDAKGGIRSLADDGD